VRVKGCAPAASQGCWSIAPSRRHPTKQPPSASSRPRCRSSSGLLAAWSP